jgi:hypothetical protein
MFTSLVRGLSTLPHRAPRGRRRKKQARRLNVERLEDRCLLSVDEVLHWNGVMMQAEANEYNPAIVSSPDQPGPTRTARAFAIESAATYDAVNSIDGSYTPYLAKIPHARGASIEAAASQAAHDTLVALFPKQQAMFDTNLTESLAAIPNGAAKRRGIAVGREAASNILADRANDGSGADMTYVPINLPGYHQLDPLHPGQGFLTPQWGEVRPFVLGSSNQFRSSGRVGETPAQRLAFLNSSEYTQAYNEVRAVGEKDSTVRTPDQTQIGIFWAYDGSPDLGTPPRSFDQVTRVIAVQEGNTEVQNARLFALVNIAMGDAGIAIWETKYFYSFWRPIVGIRNADSTGNPYTAQDPDWEYLGAQADNGSGTNFTPNFPSYDSGHATFASTTFQVLRDFYGRDSIPFSFQSDEYNGVTRDDTGAVRPPVTRSYNYLSQPEFEVHDSRIYLGIHWRFDQDEGTLQGRSVGNYVFEHILQPARPGLAGTTGDTIVDGAPLPAQPIYAPIGVTQALVSSDAAVGVTHALVSLNANQPVPISTQGTVTSQTYGALDNGLAGSLRDQVFVTRLAGTTDGTSTLAQGRAPSAGAPDGLFASRPDALSAGLEDQLVAG